MSRFTLDQLPEKYALQAQAQMQGGILCARCGKPKKLIGPRCECDEAQSPTPPTKSPRRRVSGAKQATPAPASNEQSNSSHASGSVRRAPQREPSSGAPVDAGILHPITEQVPGKTLERHPSAEIGSESGLKLRPKVHFTLYRVALLDPDNKWASVKFILDAMRYAGLIPNDRECDIELVVSQQRVPKREQEGTGVMIVYPSGRTPTQA